MKLRHIVILSLLFLLIAPASFARESSFRPARGEVLPNVNGYERVTVAEEGTLSLFNADGTLQNNFPIMPAGNSVFVSSPLLADIDGDTLANEIVAIGRDNNGLHTLYAYSGTGGQIASVQLPNATYYDPAWTDLDAAVGHEVVLATVQGEVMSATYQNNAFTITTLFSTGQPSGFTFASSSRTILVNLPQQNELRIFSGASGAWTQTATVNLSAPFIFPVVEQPGNASVVYGVIATGDLSAVDLTSGQTLAGFPVDFGDAVPVDSPILVGQELAVALSDGKVAVVGLTGALVSTTTDFDFIVESAIAADPRTGGFFAGVKSYAIRLTRAAGEMLASFYSSVRVALGIDPRSSFKDFSLEKDTQLASGADVQIGRITMTAEQADTIGDVQIILNRENTASHPERGHFQWDPVNGFRKIASSGGQFVQLDSALSRRIANSADSTVTFEFAWTALANYGQIADNTVSYYWREPGNNYSVGFSRASQTFDVNAQGVTPSTLASYVLGAQTVAGDDTQRQSMTFVVDTTHGNDIDNFQMIVNYDDGPSRYGSYFQWDSVNGFRETGSESYYRNNFVTLRVSESSRTVTSTNATFVFVWTVAPAYATPQDNDVGYFWQESATGYHVGWNIIETDFNVTTTVPSNATYNTLTFIPVVRADNTERQSARLVLNGTLAQIQEVFLMVNRQIPPANPNTMRAFAQWTPATGFREVDNSEYYGNKYIELKSLESTAAEPGDGTVVFEFKWTLSPEYGDVQDNDIAIFWRESSGYTSGWSVIDTNFDVDLSNAPVLSTLGAPVTVVPSVITNGSDTQTTTVVVNNGVGVDQMQLIINRQLLPTDPNLMRGSIEWTPAGFREIGSEAYYGNNLIQLLPENPADPLSGSRREVSGTTVTFYFRWKLSPQYGSVPVNNVSYFWRESAAGYHVGWTQAPATFTVNDQGGQFAPSSVAPPVVAPTTVTANGEQSARFVFTTARPNDLSRLQIQLTNGPTNASRHGLMAWDPVNGFIETGDVTYYGNNDITLLASQSTAVYDATAQTYTVEFRWRIEASYGASTDNDLSYVYFEDPYEYSSGWQTQETGFTIN